MENKKFAAVLFYLPALVCLGLLILSFHDYFRTLGAYVWQGTILREPEDDIFRAMDFGAEGFGEILRWAGESGADPGEALTVWMAAADYDLAGIRTEGLNAGRYEELRGQLEAENAAGFARLSQIYGALAEDLEVFPVPKNTDSACRFVTYKNGWGDPRTYGGDRRHEGCDVMGDSYADGTYPVISMTDGVVEQMGWLPLGGWRVGIRSDNGIYYYYAHMDSYGEGIEAGARVEAGMERGRMGSTGYSDVEGTSGNFATHLHVGIYIPVEGQEDLSVNPYYLLRYLEGEKVTTAEYSFEKLPASQ